MRGSIRMVGRQLKQQVVDLVHDRLAGFPCPFHHFLVVALGAREIALQEDEVGARDALHVGSCTH